MKLNFKMLEGDGILEAREKDNVYFVYESEDKWKAVVNGETLIAGNLYECLDVCNKHKEIINGQF